VKAGESVRKRFVKALQGASEALAIRTVNGSPLCMINSLLVAKNRFLMCRLLRADIALNYRCKCQQPVLGC